MAPFGLGLELLVTTQDTVKKRKQFEHKHQNFYAKASGIFSIVWNLGDLQAMRFFFLKNEAGAVRVALSPCAAGIIQNGLRWQLSSVIHQNTYDTT